MAKHFVMDHTGHTTIEFDPSNTVELAEAMERFDQIVKNGGRAATRQAGQSDYTAIKQFSQSQDETLFVPQYQGG